MALIENLVVALGLRNAGFSLGLKKAEKDLTAFQAGLQGITSKFLGFVGGFAAAYIGINSATAALQKFRDTVEELFRYGVESIKFGLDPEEFGKLKYMAATAGLTMEQFDTALQKMQVSIANAAAGEKTEMSAFTRLGTDAKSLRNLRPEEQIYKIADAFSKMTNAAERMDVIRTIFGRGGSGMAVIMDQGSVALKKLGERARELGIVFNQLDISKVMVLRNSFLDMKLAWSGMWAQFVIDAAPALTVIARHLTQLIIDTRLWASEWGLTSSILIEGAGAIASAFVILSQQMVDSIMMFKLLGAYASGDEVKLRVIKKQWEMLAKEYEGAWAGEITDKLEDEMARLRREYRRKRNEMGDGFLEVGKDLFPGAFYKGTKEAAVEAAKAGGRDRETEFEKRKVKQLDELIKLGGRIGAGVDQFGRLLGADANID